MNDRVSQVALVIAPHPDDETLGCGGTIATITSGGGVADVLFMTRGENGTFPNPPTDDTVRRELATRRENEAREACQRLGVRRVAFLPGRDGSLAEDLTLGDHILAAMREGGYRSVFFPWPYDAHSDHQATYRMTHQALSRLGKAIDVWLYEVWTPLTPNFHVAIDSTFEQKMHAFNAHESQAAILPYADAFAGLARYRALHCQPAKAAEAFFHCSSAQLINHENIPWPRPAFGAVSRAK